MFLWRKSAETRWVEVHEDLLQSHAHGRLVIVRRPQCKRLRLEIVCRSKKAAQALVAKFGGRTDQLPRKWLQRFAIQDSKPMKIGNRLIVARSIDSVRRFAHPGT